MYIYILNACLITCNFTHVCRTQKHARVHPHSKASLSLGLIILFKWYFVEITQKGSPAFGRRCRHRSLGYIASHVLHVYS